MLRGLGAAVLAIGFATVAYAQQPMQQNGRVTIVDRAGKIFSTQTMAGSATYQTSPATVFSVAGTPTSWAAVKAGAMVAVTSHTVGSNAIADAVMINQ